MKKIYVGQTSLRLTLKTGVTIGYSDFIEIKYKKPNAEIGSFTANLQDSDNGVIYYDLQESSEIDIPGWWKFWAYITFTDGRSASGQAVKVFVAEQGD